MKGKLWSVLILAGGLLAISAPLWGHHAEVVYDDKTTITLKGTVTKFLWTNPHATIHFQVKSEPGAVEDWIAEMGPLSGLTRAGWTKTTINPGDEIEIVSHPHKDGLHRVRFLRLAINGKLLRDNTTGQD